MREITGTNRRDRWRQDVHLVRFDGDDVHFILPGRVWAAPASITSRQSAPPDLRRPRQRCARRRQQECASPKAHRQSRGDATLAQSPSGLRVMVSFRRSAAAPPRAPQPHVEVTEGAPARGRCRKTGSLPRATIASAVATSFLPVPASAAAAWLAWWRSSPPTPALVSVAMEGSSAEGSTGLKLVRSCDEVSARDPVLYMTMPTMCSLVRSTARR